MVGGIALQTQVENKAFAIRQANFPAEIGFYAPGLKHYQTEDFQQKTPQLFRPISLTGKACALQCEHCKAKILEPMIALNPREGLFNLCQRLFLNGTRGVLISGGSKHNGAVPLQKYIADISRVKKELGMRVMVHCGVVDEKTAALLKAANVDGVMLDIIGAEETIREVYHLNISVKDFDRSLKYLTDYQLSVRPHIILGLHFGKFLGEYTALEIISQYPVYALVLVILTPLVDTPMEGIEPPAIPSITRFFYDARLALPETLIMLGCARPMGPHKFAVDKAAIDYGLNGIAFPAENIVSYAKSKGLTPTFFENSCSCGC